MLRKQLYYNVIKSLYKICIYTMNGQGRRKCLTNLYHCRSFQSDCNNGILWATLMCMNYEINGQYKSLCRYNVERHRSVRRPWPREKNIVCRLKNTKCKIHFFYSCETVIQRWSNLTAKLVVVIGCSVYFLLE